MADYHDVLFYYDNLENLVKVELIEITHLRWEVAFFIEKEPKRWVLKNVDQHSDEAAARRNFRQYLDKNLVAEFTKKGVTTRITKKEPAGYFFNAYVGDRRTQFEMSSEEVVRYLANAAEDGS